MEYKIKLFIVKYKWEIIQVDWITDQYNEIQIYALKEDISLENWMRWTQWEAKDLAWTYWDMEVLIIDKEITL